MRNQDPIKADKKKGEILVLIKKKIFVIHLQLIQCSIAQIEFVLENHYEKSSIQKKRM
jgi:hypothetical protein